MTVYGVPFRSHRCRIQSCKCLQTLPPQPPQRHPEGPLDGEENLEKVLDMVRQARRQGARCLTGGERSNGPGSFMQPTVFVDVDPRMPIAQEEIWGPVVSVLKFRDDAEAYRIANDVRHTGILCGIFTGSIGRLTRAAHAVRAGHIIAQVMNRMTSARSSAKAEVYAVV